MIDAKVNGVIECVDLADQEIFRKQLKHPFRYLSGSNDYLGFDTSHFME